MPPSPSIQSFFSSSSPSKSSSAHSPSKPSSSIAHGDGFTPQEALLPSPSQNPTTHWTPALTYTPLSIADVDLGPQTVTLTGRIANLHRVAKPSRRPHSAQGYFRVTLADDTGALTVRLWFKREDVYAKQLRLGVLCRVWTVHVSRVGDAGAGFGGGSAYLAPSGAAVFTSIFPEGERNCCFEIVRGDELEGSEVLCRRPFGVGGRKSLSGLMTLGSFRDGGYDVDDGKLVVCVKSVGARKKFTNKNNSVVELTSVGIFDDTAEGFLTLYGAVADSAATWTPSHTILLISNPGWRIDRIVKLTLTANTQIHVDPEMPDARYIRALAQRLTKQEHVNPPFPSHLFDPDEAQAASLRIFFKLAELDEFVRRHPREKLVGYVSVLITELHIMTNFKRNMLMSAQCCGLPVFASALEATCKHCGRRVELRVNPRILGPLIDETGQLAAGKLIFSDQAWEQLLGRSPAQLVSANRDVMAYLEQRMLFLRVTLGVGFCMGSDGVEYGGNGNGTGGGYERECLGTGEKMGTGIQEMGRLCVWSVST